MRQLIIIIVIIITAYENCETTTYIYWRIRNAVIILQVKSKDSELKVLKFNIIYNLLSELNESRKNGLRGKKIPEKWSPENWSPEKWSLEN